MALLINAQGLAKSYGASPLFRNISLNISEGDRLGLIGPNGSGKTTLLEILAGRREPDNGEVAIRKNTRLSYVAQESQFQPGHTVKAVISRALDNSAVPENEREARAAETLGRAGFTDFEVDAATLSGGWRKRLAIAEALVSAPDILLLDEPTNHLDLAGIEWLEQLLLTSNIASVVVSHDRYFLENVATVMAELNRIYPDGLLRVQGNYSTFLEKKSDFQIAQTKRQEALENRVRTEIQWLRRGPKARATKAKARIDNAREMIGELKDLNERTRSGTAELDFTATERKTKRLIELKNVRISFRQSFDIRWRKLHARGRNASGARRSERQRKNDASAPHARRDRSSRGRGVSRGIIADCLLRSKPTSRSGTHFASCARPGRRLCYISGPADSRGVLGRAIPVLE